MNKTENWKARLDASRGKAELIIGKNRHGKPETIKLKFIDQYTLFEDLDEGFNAADDMPFVPMPAVAEAPNMDDVPDM